MSFTALSVLLQSYLAEECQVLSFLKKCRHPFVCADTIKGEKNLPFEQVIDVQQNEADRAGKNILGVNIGRLVMMILH